jgi:DNA repair protein RecO (recombination protein O)
MYAETEGIMLKQIKIAGGRRMLVLFTKRYGKISAGTSLNEKGKSRSALSLRPFTHGSYGINKTGENYHVNKGQVLSSHYGIGEALEKYMCASYALEVTEKFLQEDCPAPGIFTDLVDFLNMIEKRNKKHETLVIAYLFRLLKHSGCAPVLDSCILCGSKEGLYCLNVSEGGLCCDVCRDRFLSNERLIYPMEFAIVKVLGYIMKNPLQVLEGLAIDDATTRKLLALLKDYLACHLDIGGLKSEEFIENL